MSSFTLIRCMILLAGVTLTNSQTEKPQNVTKPSCVKRGIIFPYWEPWDPEIGDRIARAMVYFAGLVFMFLGVSIIADRFMSAIEIITSKEKEVTVKKPNGETIVVSVRIWNETVSNLTLMALGSSAPEILLSVIEVVFNGFNAGDLGPGTIVGSAAFNLFVIIAVCVYVIPDGDARRIKHLRVFLVTATFSILAYIWLYMILVPISKGVVQVWEALFTLALFPITVVWAYIADRRIFFYKFLRKKYKAEKIIRRGSNLPGSMELGEANANHFKSVNHDYANDVEFSGKKYDDTEPQMDDIKDLEENKREFIRLLRELRQKHPDADLHTLEQMANFEALSQKSKSRAFYRIQATRKMCGAGNILKKTIDKKRASVAEVKIEVPQDDNTAHVFFEPHQYTVMENVGSFNITVSRQGGDMNSTVYVDYRTEDGTANAGSDYHFADGTLIFKPGETQKEIGLTIIDDDIFEEDEHFYVNLSNVRIGGPDGMFQSNQAGPLAKLVEPTMAMVTILDDDHSGIFHLEEPSTKIAESAGNAQFKLARSSGARGTVRVPYKTIEGTAKGNGVDYIDVEGELEFENDETWKYIEVTIIDDEEYEKDVNFFIQLGEPRLIRRGSDSESYSSEKDQLLTNEDKRIADLGRPQLGEITRMEVRVMESTEFKNTVDKLIKKANLSLVVGTSSWREQFAEALSVSAGDDEDEDGEEQLPSCSDYIMHFLTIFWKIMFAFVPPTDIWGGWACFVVAICMIGVLTAFIGDLATHFGCTIGLKDSVTAISFVALGTSVPGDDDDEDGEERLPSWFDYVMHFLTIFWKLLFAFVPPTDIWNGWACFVASICMIGVLTAFVGDIASHFGCTIGLKDSVTAISLVALGTSVPDMFASKVAAIGDKYADASIGNVTGSNAVNVFLGIGVAWTFAALYHAARGDEFRVESGTLGFSVTLFTILACSAVTLLMIRRKFARYDGEESGAELGGPRKWKIFTTSYFLCLWCFYILLCSLVAYGIIEPGF